MKQRNLQILPAGCSELSYMMRKSLYILPNRIIFFPLPDRVAIVEVVRSTRGEDFAVNTNAVKYVLECEGRGGQGYIRAVDDEGRQIWQDTIGNYSRRIEGYAPRESENELFGPYHWINGAGMPIGSFDPLHRAEIKTPPWL